MKNTYESNSINNNEKLIVKTIDPYSIAQELDIEIGDEIVSINSKSKIDELDFYYLTSSDQFTLEILKQNGEVWELEIEKDYDENLGITLEENLETKTCSNNCIFCFIDQLPDGLRETLYIKDDDERLSFINGNYVTLTNLTEDELNRICEWKIPINISIHTTDPILRKKILRNKEADQILDKLKKLYDNKVMMNAQIVLMPEENDITLEKTIDDLAQFFPYLQSISVVPVGLTKFRDDLYPLRIFTKEEATEVIDLINKKQKEYLQNFNTRFVFASDEFYLTAKKQLPSINDYEDFKQLENGVGMITSFSDEFLNALDHYNNEVDGRKVILATGVLFEPVLKELITEFIRKFPDNELKVIGVKNNFFGKNITVSGLLTGQDIIEQLSKVENLENYSEILLPDSVLKNNSNLLLDDTTLEDIEKSLNLPIKIVKNDGRDLVNKLIGE